MNEKIYTGPGSSPDPRPTPSVSSIAECEHRRSQWEGFNRKGFNNTNPVNDKARIALHREMLLQRLEELEKVIEHLSQRLNPILTPVQSGAPEPMYNQISLIEL